MQIQGPVDNFDKWSGAIRDPKAFDQLFIRYYWNTPAKISFICRSFISKHSVIGRQKNPKQKPPHEEISQFLHEAASLYNNGILYYVKHRHTFNFMFPACLNSSTFLEAYFHNLVQLYVLSSFNFLHNGIYAPLGYFRKVLAYGCYGGV